MWIFVALIVVPIIEIALFIQVGGWIGLWPTIAIVLATAIAGAALLRSQGFQAMGELQRRLETGEDPTPLLAHGAMILVAGVVLLTPGFFTDAVGFALLIPPVRDAIISALAKRIHLVQASAVHRAQRPASAPGEQTIETEYEEVAPPTSGSAPGPTPGRRPGSRPSGWQGGPGGPGGTS